jgi:DNA repair exonuclease SbcCD ATPase subunit
MIPIYLLLENFMSHARSELDFTLFDMALIVGMENDDPDASNGIGKTALFDAVRWVLYGKCRFRTRKRVIKRGKASCTVTFVFQLQNDTYKIVRKMSQRSASNEISLLMKDGDAWRDLSCDTPSATGGKIEELVKLGHDTFENSIYFKQNEILQFTSATASQKKDTLKEGLEIEIWDRYQDKAKEIARRLSARMSALDERLKSFGSLDRDIAANKIVMEGLRTRISDRQASLADGERNLEEARSKLAAIADSGVVSGRLAAIMARASAIKARKQSIVSDMSAYRTDLEKVRKLRNDTEEHLREAARQILVVSVHPRRAVAEAIFRRIAPAYKIPSFTVFCDKLSQDRKALGDCQRASADAALQLKHLLALEPGKKCPTCLSTMDNPDEVTRQRKKRAKFLENVRNEAESMADELTRSVLRQEKLVDKANAAALQIDHMDASMLQADGQIGHLETLLSNLKSELGLLADEWKSLKDEKTSLCGGNDDKDIDMLRQLIAQSEKDLDAGQRSLVEMSVEYGNLQGHAEDMERSLSERDTLASQKPALARDLEVHTQLVKAFGKNGVPAIIMENVTEDLKNYANDILRRISDKPMSVEFITQRRTESGSWSETFDIMVMIDDETNEFEDLSGGEQVRAAIAIRLALSSVLMRRMGSSVRFLLLDEVDQALDRRGVQALADALHIISKEFKILVITHNETMKERFDHIITVQKGPSGSFLRQ